MNLTFQQLVAVYALLAICSIMVSAALTFLMETIGPQNIPRKIYPKHIIITSLFLVPGFNVVFLLFYGIVILCVSYNKHIN